MTLIACGVTGTAAVKQVDGEIVWIEAAEWVHIDSVLWGMADESAPIRDKYVVVGRCPYNVQHLHGHRKDMTEDPVTREGLFKAWHEWWENNSLLKDDACVAAAHALADFGHPLPKEG